MVLDTESLEEIMGYTHRKEEISDIKFSPGRQCVKWVSLDFRRVWAPTRLMGLRGDFLIFWNYSNQRIVQLKLI